jgi:DNA-directed RNA polymerase specialized sigma24 family protein
MHPKRHGPRFETTRWTLVLAAGGAATPDSREALAALCEQYWYPLYAYLRRAGHTASDAEDLTQGFFLQLLEKNALRIVDRARGRFRSFLLAALKHFVANEWDRRRAKKRGGPHPPIALELSSGEQRYQLEPRDDSTPERLYDRQWALTVLDRTLDRLRAEFRTAGKEALFDRLSPYLTPDEVGPPYAETAAASGMTEGATKVAVHRLRRRYRDLLRIEIAQTVTSPEEIKAEISHLMSAVGR